MVRGHCLDTTILYTPLELICTRGQLDAPEKIKCASVARNVLCASSGSCLCAARKKKIYDPFLERYKLRWISFAECPFPIHSKFRRLFRRLYRRLYRRLLVCLLVSLSVSLSCMPEKPFPATVPNFGEEKSTQIPRAYLSTRDLPPMRCYTCAHMVATSICAVHAAIEADPSLSLASLLQAHDLSRLCCRRMALGHINAFEQNERANARRPHL